MELEDIVISTSNKHNNKDSMKSINPEVVISTSSIHNNKDSIKSISPDVASIARNRIEELENHIDILHTKLNAAEERIAILESIVLKK